MGEEPVFFGGLEEKRGIHFEGKGDERGRDKDGEIKVDRRASSRNV